MCQSPVLSRDQLLALQDNSPEAGEYNIADHLPGPLNDTERYADKYEILKEYQEDRAIGRNHLRWLEYQQRYGKQGLNSNFVLPIISPEVGKEPVINQQIFLCHVGDCARIAKAHVRKQPNFTPAFQGSVISTTDNDHWRKQREYLTGPFMPTSSLSHIFDTRCVKFDLPFKLQSQYEH